MNVAQKNYQRRAFGFLLPRFLSISSRSSSSAANSSSRFSSATWTQGTRRTHEGERGGGGSCIRIQDSEKDICTWPVLWRQIPSWLGSPSLRTPWAAAPTPPVDWKSAKLNIWWSSQCLDFQSFIVIMIMKGKLINDYGKGLWQWQWRRRSRKK